MKMRQGLLTGVMLALSSCAAGNRPAEPPPEPDREKAEVSAEAFSDGSDGDSDAEEGDDSVHLVSCAGKDATFWGNGAMKSQVLTSECTFDGRTYPAGTLMEFDKNGVLLPGS